MPTTLVDTAAWIALVNTRDELHHRAKQTMSELHRSNVALVTTEFVLLEVANAFCASAWRGQAIKLIDGLRSVPNLRIIEADSSLLAEGWRLFAAGWIKSGVSLTALVWWLCRRSRSNRHLPPTIISSKQDSLNCYKAAHVPSFQS